ncbi:5,10-methylene-tetrahydrofolate dehydrogenase [Staphylococcus caprae]|uniref:5,10-methylene-tetrahydrofolate dehydrogenase n=1 Tax=Staphylococcus caprae TaxID=29380 RepID=UPI003B21DA57
MYTVGLIPSPGVAHEHAKKIIPRVKKLLTERIDGDNHWNFDIKVDLMIGSAEDVHESVDKAAKLKEQHQWDYVICLTDLPSISDNKVVISDYNSEKQVAMLSLPSLGVIDLKRKLIKTVTSLIEQLYYERPKSKNAPHPFVRMKAVEPEEDESSKERYINTLFIMSWIQLVAGLTRANQPWKNIFNFKKIISVAFATGTYISIFSMPWELSVIYSPFRLILLMVIAIVGMAGWLFYAHQLLERKTAKSQRVYRYIYNSTTLVTLSMITLINYFILYILLAISITLFVPVDLFNSWTSAKAQFTFTNYLRLIWFVASLGLLAGAMGSTVENEEKIRRITYSYRQYHRYKEAEQEEEQQEESQDVSHQKVEQQASSNENKDEQYEGKKQGHREEDES